MTNWPFWDDYLADELRGMGLAGKQKKKMDTFKKRSAWRKELGKEMLQGAKKPKGSRVDGVLAAFRTLSQIEKENFVNAIRNFVVHGHL